MVVKILEESFSETDEKMLLLAILGNLEAVQKGVITIDEAEKFIFSPYIARKLTIKGCNKQIIKLVKKGCELEDINSLIPEKINQVLDELKKETLNLIDNYKTFDSSFWIETM